MNTQVLLMPPHHSEFNNPYNNMLHHNFSQQHNTDNSRNNVYSSHKFSDFNKELSYDYSNNTFNPKLSLRSYCYSPPDNNSSSTLATSNTKQSRPLPLPSFYSSESTLNDTPQLSHNSFLTRSDSPVSGSSYQHPYNGFSNLMLASSSASLANKQTNLSNTSNPGNLTSDNIANLKSFTPPNYPSNLSTGSYPNTTASTPNSDSLLSPNSDSDTTSFGNASGVESASGANKKKKRSNLPKKTTKILIDWLNDNLNNPYPNSKEKFELIMKTGLTNQQLSNWFINARRRKINNLRENQSKGDQGVLN